jgi:S1-C subfamily serine protease
MMYRKKIIFFYFFIAGLFIYTGYKVSKLSERIQRIEGKLGGVKNILCNQKDTVEKARKSVVRIVGGHGEGSGFAVKKGGFILTNFHVIADELAPKIILPDNTFQTAKVIMADKAADLAILKVKKDIPTLNFARLSWVNPVEEIMLIGYPFGGELDGESFVTRGVISRLVLDKENNLKYILTDMTLIGGVSGGPMINICGEVVGVVCAGISPGGMGIAISSDSIFERVIKMLASEDPLKDVKKISFNPDKNALEAVRSFYNYLKLRSMENAFCLLSDNFIKGYSFKD